MREKRAVTRFCLPMLCLSALLLGAAPDASANGSGAPMNPAMPGMAAMPMQQTMPGMSIYNLAQKWTTQSGAVAELASLRGQPVLAAMVYTHCKDVCPLIAEKMQEIAAGLPKQSQARIRLVLFSMDWVRDTPEQLRTFASQHRLDLQHWTLFHGDESAVRMLAAALGISFHRDANGDFQHSIAIFLLDSNGVVAGQETDLTKPPSEMIAKIGHLLGHQSRVH